MNETTTDNPSRALEFISRANSYLLVVTIVLLAWVASGVEFSAESLRFASMACLTLSVIFGVLTLAFIPLVQEERRPGQSNFDVEVRFWPFGQRRSRLKSVLLPQHVLLIAGLVLYIVGMV